MRARRQKNHYEVGIVQFIVHHTPHRITYRFQIVIVDDNKYMRYIWEKIKKCVSFCFFYQYLFYFFEEV